MTTELSCEQCGAANDVRIEIEGREMTAAEYTKLAHMAGGRVLCDDCGRASGMAPVPDVD